MASNGRKPSKPNTMLPTNTPPRGLCSFTSRRKAPLAVGKGSHHPRRFFSHHAFFVEGAGGFSHRRLLRFLSSSPFSSFLVTATTTSWAFFRAPGGPAALFQSLAVLLLPMMLCSMWRQFRTLFSPGHGAVAGEGCQ